MNTTTRFASAGRVLLFAGMALALVAGLFAGPRAALAHAHLESSSPAADSTVDAGLTSISLAFSEDISVDASTAQLDGPSGSVAGVTAAVDRADRTRMTITTPPLTAGAYTLHWTAVTEDDNGTTNGTLNFTVAGASSPSATGSTTTSPATTTSGSGASLPATGDGQFDLVLWLAGSIALAMLGLGFVARVRARA
jgi:methionine-rich copper-binding protein CopC